MLKTGSQTKKNWGVNKIGDLASKSKDEAYRQRKEEIAKEMTVDFF